MAWRIAEAVRAEGGRVFYVGGFVRDGLMGRENKDIDIEVHGISVRALEAILDGLGTRVSMGASFGVMGLQHYDVDIAMPRSERATGRGHKDFEVFVDPFIGYERAALRRDFTINALMQDVLTGEILDFFGGREDLARGRIRHVSDATFAEDPLRVFRAAQFAARFGFSVSEETTRLCRKMAVEALAPERVMGELEKALLKANRPSIFFEVLSAMAQLETWFPEMARHPGEQWTHTLDTLNWAAGFRESVAEPLYFMLAALMIDLIPSDACRFLNRLTHETGAAKYALNMIECRRDAAACLSASAGEEEWMALLDRAACPADLGPLAMAAGCRPEEGKTIAAMFGLYRERMNRPFVMGRDLVAAGIHPGPEMGAALKHAHRLRLQGVSKDEQLSQTLEWFRARSDKGR